MTASPPPVPVHPPSRADGDRTEPTVSPGPDSGTTAAAAVPSTAAPAGAPPGSAPAAGGAETGGRGGFHVHLDAFEGPFDLLLGLIAKHKLDVTEIALSKVTDEFIAYIHGNGPHWDLGQATEFLVVAATLLDLKAARLLPAAEVEDEEDLALLEARDLLFARLLQYRAYKQVAALFAERMAEAGRRHPRTTGPDPAFANLLPDVLIPLGPDAFAALAARALTPRTPPTVSISHIHRPLVSVREQAHVIVTRLRRLRTATFRVLTADAPDTLTVVARFLALLELFREAAVAFDQAEALGELHIRWTGSEDGDLAVTDEFDGAEGPGAPTRAESGVAGGVGTAPAARPPSADGPDGDGPDGDGADGDAQLAPPVSLDTVRAARATAGRVPAESPQEQR